jgi:hypothetical protein
MQENEEDSSINFRVLTALHRETIHRIVNNLKTDRITTGKKKEGWKHLSAH